MTICKLIPMQLIIWVKSPTLRSGFAIMYWSSMKHVSGSVHPQMSDRFCFWQLRSLKKKFHQNSATTQPKGSPETRDERTVLPTTPSAYEFQLNSVAVNLQGCVAVKLYYPLVN